MKILGGLIAALLLTVSAEAGTITDLRCSNSPAKTRIVAESDEAIEFTAEKDGKKLVLQLPESSTVPRRLRPGGDCVKDIALEREGRSASRLTVQLRQDRQYKIFRLTQPERLVIDIYRIEIASFKRQLAKGVDYTYYQDELNGRPVQAYTVTVAPAAPYEVRPFSAAGTYNGRGLVSRYAKERHLVCAVNSSYFDTDGWVIGTTKYKDMIISGDGTPRSALAVKDGRPFIVKDVAWRARASLPDGTVLPIKGLNRARITDDVVLFNEHYAPATKTNQWGAEAAIERSTGKVTAVSLKGNMPIRPGTFVLSAHGKFKNKVAALKAGDRVEVLETLSSAVANTADVVVGGGPLLIENGQVRVRSAEEKMAGDIAKGRAPRTAAGIMKDGSLLLAVVDGRSLFSAGLTLEELAEYLQRLGVREAVNFDGGGSSVMTVNGGKIMNRPSDGRERAVSMGLGLFKK